MSGFQKLLGAGFKTWCALVLCLLCLTQGQGLLWSVPVQAASASEAVPAKRYGIYLPSKEMSHRQDIQPLLTVLKQLDPYYSMIQDGQDLDGNLDRVLVVFDRYTTQKTFEQVEALIQKAQGPQFVMIPADFELTPAMQAFFKGQGFDVTGSYITTRQLSVTVADSTPSNQCIIPAGVSVYRTNPQTTPAGQVVAYLNQASPVVVKSAQAPSRAHQLLLTTNLAIGCSAQELVSVLDHAGSPTQGQSQPELTVPQQTVNHSWDSIKHMTVSDVRAESQLAADSASDRHSPFHREIQMTLSQPIEKPRLDDKPYGSKLQPQTAEDPASPYLKQTLKPPPYAQRHYDTPSTTVTAPPPSPPSIPISTPAPTQTQMPDTVASPPAAKAKTAAGSESYPDFLYSFEGEEDRPEGFRPKWTKDNRTAMADFYNQRMREYYKLRDTVEALSAKYPQNSPRANDIAQAIDVSRDNKSMFETAWFDQRYTEALVSLNNARSSLIGVLFDKVPSSHVEGRCIWLDRGSIIDAGGPEALRALIRRIAKSGFNVIYFETVNAGYPIYPSHVTQQNPQTLGWDPLQIAVDEAHKQNVELHAWVWVFAVGNTRHNRLLDLPDSYPGPILSTRPDLMSAALRGPGGELVLPGQFEYWLSPASRKARQFLTTLFSEVVQNYDVDGLQLDYIRYPFQKPGHYVGYEHVSRTRYSAETGMSDYVGTSGFQAWQAWKAFQVTTFVKELSAHLRQIKPDLKLSAAVFPMHRHKRMQMIQQDWETWVRKGWVETLNPMAYSNSAHSLVGLVDYVHQVGGDKVLVYPGLSLLKLNAVELVDKMEMIRDKGLLGTALFAYAHFGPDTQYLVQSGPYLEKNVISPHRKPLLASRQLTKEVLAMVNNLLKAKDQDTNYEVLYEIQHKLVAVDEALNALSKPSLSRTDAHYYLEVARNDALGIERLMESWRQATEADSVEAYRANYLNDNVAKMVRMVNYATYKQQLEFDRQGLSMQPALPNSPSPTSTNPPPPTAVPKVSVLLKP